VNTALDYLLRHPQGDNTDLTQQFSSQVNVTPIVIILGQISDNRVDKKMAEDNWMQLVRPLANTTAYISATLEANLSKIIQNSSHPMGKKMNMFLIAFNANYSGLCSPSDANNRYVKAVQEVHQFSSSMKNSITAKVNEFNTTIGSMVVWKVVESVIFPGIYSNLFPVYQQKFADLDNAKSTLIQLFQPKPITQFGIAERFQLSKDSQAYSEAFATLQGISFAKTIYDKLNCLIGTCHSIVDTVKQYYVTSGSASQSINITADYLLPIFTYVLCKAQIPFVYSEISFLLEFIPEGLRSTQEAFAMATFQAAINYLDKLKANLTRSNANAPVKSTSPQPPIKNHERDLISFEENHSVPNNNTRTPPFNPEYRGTAVKPSTPSAPPPVEDDKFATLNRVEKEYIIALKRMNTVDAYNQLAVYYNTKGKLLKAIDYCNRALKVDPRNVVAMQNIAVYSNQLISQQTK